MVHRAVHGPCGRTQLPLPAGGTTALPIHLGFTQPVLLANHTRVGKTGSRMVRLADRNTQAQEQPKLKAMRGRYTKIAGVCTQKVQPTVWRQLGRHAQPVLQHAIGPRAATKPAQSGRQIKRS